MRFNIGIWHYFPLHNEYNTSMGVIYIESKNFKEENIN